ncbi:hypothetical protein P7K49_000205, partial [Saguinus oedipus]
PTGKAGFLLALPVGPEPPVPPPPSAHGDQSSQRSRFGARWSPLRNAAEAARWSRRSAGSFRCHG